jgi:Deoxynucleoside kinases
LRRIAVPRPFYLAIEGVIGVGKTALARLLQPRFQADLLLEVFEENPFLSDFYADRQRYAFQTQIFFLLSRYRQQQEVRRNDRPLIADYTFAKDRLFAHLNLQGTNWQPMNGFTKHWRRSGPPRPGGVPRPVWMC